MAGERICTRFPADYETRFRNYDIIWFTEADGSFTSFYDETVRNRFNVANDDYEEHKERELLARYYLAALAAAVDVPPAQVADVFARRNTTVDLEFIALDPERVDPVSPSETEVAAWAATHAAEIEAAYTADTERFEEPREVRIRRIYIRKPAEDSADFADAQARYESALSRVTEGAEEFEAVARELSEIEREAEEGGDMGMRTSDTISSDIWETTEAMSIGDIEGVEQQYAWNIIKLEEESEARTRPLEEVRDELATELLTAELNSAAAAELEERGARILELAADAESLGSRCRCRGSRGNRRAQRRGRRHGRARRRRGRVDGRRR